MEAGSMPRPTSEAKAAFTKLVPAGPAVTMRPMFGNLAAFVNGNMFAGLFGEDLFVRVSDDEGAKVRKQGGRDFEPMPGRAMRGYVTVPSTWRSKPAAARAWIMVALKQTQKMPPKVPAAKKAAVKKPVKAR
jgi:TfoX/Sxy family transcriptional regulator of competence genes